jgi:hypothetical protein
MKYIGQRLFTPSQAKEAIHLGFILNHIMMHLDGTDSYNVYVKGA